MAFRKFKKAYRKGKKAYKFAKKHQSEARQALSLARKVARVVNTEYKYTIDTSNIANLSWAGQIIPLCKPVQGLTTNDRIGCSIRLMRLSGRIAIYLNSASSHSHVRVILFRGKNEDNIVPTPTDVLDNTTGGQFFMAPKNENNKYNSKFIYDKTYSLSTGSRNTILLKYNFKMYGHVNFTPGVATANVENGGLYMLVVSNEPTNGPNFVSTMRTSYVDN